MTQLPPGVAQVVQSSVNPYPVYITASSILASGTHFADIRDFLKLSIVTIFVTVPVF